MPNGKYARIPSVSHPLFKLNSKYTPMTFANWILLVSPWPCLELAEHSRFVDFTFTYIEKVGLTLYNIGILMMFSFLDWIERDDFCIVSRNFALKGIPRPALLKLPKEKRQKKIHDLESLSWIFHNHWLELKKKYCRWAG